MITTQTNLYTGASGDSYSDNKPMNKLASDYNKATHKFTYDRFGRVIGESEGNEPNRNQHGTTTIRRRVNSTSALPLV